MDIVLLEVGAHMRREYRVNRFAFLELAKGSTFKKKNSLLILDGLLDGFGALFLCHQIYSRQKKTTIKKTQSHTVT